MATKLEELLLHKESKWKNYHNGRTLLEALKEVRSNLKPYIDEAEKGAMSAEIKEVYAKIKAEISELENSDEIASSVLKIIGDEPVLYLNNHGEEHISRVIEKAELIVNYFEGKELSAFEAFILLCAIHIHDIGNVLGRVGHEKKLCEIFDDHVKDIIPDTPERRIIKSIAKAHGGKASDGSKNTISELNNSEVLFEENVRPRLLAAILRMADELADDCTRKSAGALDLGIIGDTSILFQDYSRVLHTATIKANDNSECQIELVFELEVKDLEKEYSIGGEKVFLLDEIYNRTIKMERERRYCQKFMNSEVNIGAISVTINIYGEYSTKVDGITYRLEDINYPNDPANGTIKEIIADEIRSGKEELAYVHGKEDKNEY